MNYLAFEPLLIEHLKALPFKAVLSSEQLSVLEEKCQPTPAAHVIYLGDRVDDTAQGGLYSRVKQHWMVTVTVRYVSTSNARQQAGELMAAVLSHVQGWKPPATLGCVKRVNANTMPLYKNGYAYFPLVFETSLKVEGN